MSGQSEKRLPEWKRRDQGIYATFGDRADYKLIIFVQMDNPVVLTSCTLFVCSRLYSLFHFLHQGRNRAAQGCDLRAGMAVYPTGTGFKVQSYGTTDEPDGTALPLLLPSVWHSSSHFLPLAASDWPTEIVHSKVWLISSYFCPVPGNKAAPLLACASQHHCDTTIA